MRLGAPRYAQEQFDVLWPVDVERDVRQRQHGVEDSRAPCCVAMSDEAIVAEARRNAARGTHQHGVGAAQIGRWHERQCGTALSMYRQDVINVPRHEERDVHGDDEDGIGTLVHQ